MGQDLVVPWGRIWWGCGAGPPPPLGPTTTVLPTGIVLGTIFVGGSLMAGDQLSPGDLMSFLVASQTVQRSGQVLVPPLAPW